MLKPAMSLEEQAQKIVRLKTLVDTTREHMEQTRRDADSARVAHDNAVIGLEKAFSAFAEAMDQGTVVGP